LAAGNYQDADLGVALDYSRFSVEGGIYLDVYLLVPQASMTYKTTESGLTADVVFQAALLQGDVVPYNPDRWQRIFRVDDQAKIGDLGFVPDISKFFVEEGDYILQVDILDVNSNRRQRIRKPVSLKKYPQDELSFSDITLASKIVKAAQENEFTKYGYDILPNAERTFTPAAPMLYYFFEIYGLSGKGKYGVHTQINSFSDKVVKDYPVKVKQSPGTSAVEWGGVNTAGLKTGIHKLLVTISDESTGTSVSHSKIFYILKPDENEEAETQNDYDDLSEIELDEIFELVGIVMTADEKRLFKKSTLEGKRKILAAFWERKDPDPSTGVNEFKQEFYRRVQIANAEFGKDTEQGWKTDRGRVIILYGKPNNIEKHHVTIGQRPWEGWYYYEIEGGVEFIFVDRSGYGRFDLVHSTAQNEILDENWQRYLNSRN
jgi:GWxTD domain-containing protein